ncbi:unnamed protein product [Caenorhabditis sp. 36 PRJEB53466]|nr:unnamed protein product [Caenorhabditis sp. 36 PRJEB53466]
MSKQQRRKGNAKNASSAAAHGYLSQGGATLVGLTPEMNIFEVASSNKLHQMSEIDDETRIVMKKLTKKDALTREKGLKELMELIQMETTSIENCYEHFCGLVAQLSTDGSPSVRMLTMKTITLFLVKLKKSASKGLKKVIPMVLFAKSDVTNGVAAAASAVIRDGFDAEKKQQVVEVFAPTAFEIAANIAQGKHELTVPVEYDASEDKEARTSRLESQALNMFLSYLKEFGNESSIWQEHARKLFENTEYVKKVFSGKRESVRIQLLTLCYRFADHVDVMLNVPPIIPYIQNTLDAQTFTPECATAWEGIILLIHNERFGTKVSLQKAIFPRFLNVIRKKGNHWRVLKHYLLPAVVALLKELNNPGGDLKSVTSIMESFTDNLPWSADASTNAIHCWFHTYANFVRWILTNDRINLDILQSLIPLTCKISEQAMSLNTAEATECVSELIFWMIEKGSLGESEIRRLCQMLEAQITETDTEKSRLLRDALTAPGRLLQLSHLHATLLQTHNLSDFSVIRNLARSENDYFQAALQKITDFSFVENTDSFDAIQSEDVVKLILMILNSGKTLKITVKNDHVGRQLLLSGESKIWDELLKSVPESVFQEMINHWHEQRNGKANATAVNFLKQMGISLNTEEAAENVDFLISFLHTMNTNDPAYSEEKSTLVKKLFVALFESEDEPKQEHFHTVAGHLTTNFNSDHFFEKLFANNEDLDAERILELSGRLDKLIGMCSEESRVVIAEKILFSKEEYNEMVAKLHFLELDIFTYSQKANVLTDAFCKSVKHLEEREAKALVTVFGRRVLFNLASHYHTSFHKSMGWQMIQVIRSVGERYCLKVLDEELNHLKAEIEKRVRKSDGVEKLILENRAANFFAEQYGITVEQERILNTFEGEDKEKSARQIEQIFPSICENPIEYLENILEFSHSEDSIDLFHFNFTKQNDWLANIMFAKRFIESKGAIFDTENFELKDAALCGIVTVLDKSTEILSTNPHAFEEDPRLEVLTTLYLELFLVLTKAAADEENSQQSVDEWNEFYTPTIRSYLIRLFRSVRKEQQPTPFFRSLLKVLFSLPEFPSNCSGDDDETGREFVPELSVFNYLPFQESCISHAFSLLTSSIEHIQLIGFAVAKLLMPIMFKVENEVALREQEEGEETFQVSTNRPKLNLPVMIPKCYPEKYHSHLGPLLLDLALTPLEKPEASFKQEHRVSYCDTIDPFIKKGLNSLMIDQPFEFRRMPISCRIPKSQEREYYLVADHSANPVFFDKFATRLLFKSVTLLPAVVRLFYKGMPNCFMPMFHEAVTKYASKLLIEQELAKVRQAAFGGEMKVRTVPVTGEIIAEYVVEETKMKLTIGLPPDYPLSVPTMTLDKAIVKTDRAKKWLLQLNAYLFHQNGAILEGIEMWKRNVDKGVEGVEDCTICMMTVHQTTHQLPKVKCKQCKNKFHSNCLYKWFESSNQSTCPLCRNNFT